MSQPPLPFTVCLANAPQMNQPLRGDVAEILVYNRRFHDPDEFHKVEDYLLKKWGCRPDPGSQGWLRPSNVLPEVSRARTDLPLHDQKDAGKWSVYEPWTDEFDTGKLDETRWYDHNPGWHGRAPARYLPRNVSVTNEGMGITMSMDAPKEPLLLYGEGSSPYRYAAASVVSKAARTYGAFEIRCRTMPSYATSAWWFTGRARNAKGEIYANEIDVLEVGNVPNEEGRMGGNLHVDKAPGLTQKPPPNPAGWFAPFHLAKGWHTYGVDWGPDYIRWYVDGSCFRSVRNTEWHSPLRMLFDTEIWSWWPDPLPEEFPSTFRTDYVRAWSRPDWPEPTDLEVIPLGHEISTLLDAERDDADAIRHSVARYHEGAAASEATLRLVYFHPAGVAPQTDYEARITRIMLDNQAFLKDEMARYGFDDAVLPLEMADAAVRVHVVVGKDKADGYTHQSGKKVKTEIRTALKDSFDLDKEFVLIFHGMCRIDGERSYYFYVPYYGDPGSNHQSELCHVADCEILDPALLTDTDRRMKYKEHYGNFTQSVAGFNTKYLGGTIHELGHGLGLPHNSQTREEMRTLGTALMGAGNHTYRRELWSKKKGTFLSFSSAARLASHPLFTGSNRGRETHGKSRLYDLQFGGEGSRLHITGKLAGTPDAYAAIAYLAPDGGSDYDAVATAVAVRNDSFQLDSRCIKSGRHSLRIPVCHLNGAVSTHRFTLNANDEKEPDRQGISQGQQR